MKKISSSLVLTALALSLGTAYASSHREAPGIAATPKVDASDFYFFKSTETGRQGYVTLIANYQPMQDTFGGPNYFTMDPNALYEIHLDNNGDAQEDVTFQFQFKEIYRNALLPIPGSDGRTVQQQVPLRAIGPVASAEDANLNVLEKYSLSVAKGGRRTASTGVRTTRGVVSLDNPLSKPMDYAGQKTFENYNSYANSMIHTFTFDGCTQPSRVFVGQRSDPFYVDLGNVFDLANFSPADITGANGETGGNNTLRNKAVTSIALEVPISCITNGMEPVVGAWTTSSLRQNRVINPSPFGLDDETRNIGPWAQTSRLGMPLVNELVIGLGDKDRFNASKPVNDGADPKFASYVTHPTFPALVQALFGVQPPANPRQDLVNTFLTGITGLNQPANVTAGEMLRLNTSTPATAPAAANVMGVIGGDVAGYPNGRRVYDDVVDITLRVAQGVLCTLNDRATFGCVAQDAPAGSIPYTDRVRVAPTAYPNVFPYLNTPVAGNLPQSGGVR